MELPVREIRALCVRFGVERLAVFGSAVTAFSAQTALATSVLARADSAPQAILGFLQ